MNVNLVHLPTIRLELVDYRNKRLGINGPMRLGNAYPNIMPSSLPRVAGAIRGGVGGEREIRVGITDLRAIAPLEEKHFKTVRWEGHRVDVMRVGASFEQAEAAIRSSDVLGLSSHFTYESGVIVEFMGFAKRLKPGVLIAVGGADVRARPEYYLQNGADIVLTGDVKPEELKSPRGKRIVDYRIPFGELAKPAFDLLPNLSRYVDSHDGPVPEGVPTPIAFVYFTRGCFRDCGYCETAGTRHEMIDLQIAELMARHYKDSGIRTLNIIDDNLLLGVRKYSGGKVVGTNEGARDKVISLFGMLGGMGFAWEFPNGLEVGLLADENGRLDEELIRALFYRARNERGEIVGAYRLYFPIETFEKREGQKKLRELAVQDEVIRYLCSSGIPEIAFGVIIFENATRGTFDRTKEEYARIKSIVTGSGNGGTKARYTLFHLAPIATYRGRTDYSDPELTGFFYTPTVRGTLSPKERFELGLEVSLEVDPVNFRSMVESGAYRYGKYSPE